MKRYLVFKGEFYYPVGGWEDYVATFDKFADADALAAQLEGQEWSHIVDTTINAIVQEHVRA